LAGNYADALKTFKLAQGFRETADEGLILHNMGVAAAAVKHVFDLCLCLNAHRLAS